MLDFGGLIESLHSHGGMPTPPDDPRYPKTVADLRQEMKTLKATLPESVFTVFQMAVEAHLTKRLEGARAYYERLRAIPRANGGTYDLADCSEVFRHNLQLLEFAEGLAKRQQRR